MELAEAVGAVIKEARRERGLSQPALAHECGIDEVTVSRIENAVRVPGLGTFIRLAKGLGVTPAELMRRVQELEPET